MPRLRGTYWPNDDDEAIQADERRNLSRILKRGRRKGQRVQRESILRIVRGDHSKLLRVLNWDRPSRPLGRDLSGFARAIWNYRENRPEGHFGFIVSQWMLQDFAREVVASAGRPPADVILDRLHVLLVPLPLVGKGNRASLPPLRFAERVEWFRTAARALLVFWAAPDDWLARLRLCRFKQCEEAFFLDESIDHRAKYCSASHRVAASRHRTK